LDTSTLCSYRSSCWYWCFPHCHCFNNKLKDEQTLDLTISAISEAALEAWHKINRIRYEQTIQIKFSIVRDDDIDVIAVTVEHYFKYRNLTDFSKNFNLEIFTDFREAKQTDNRPKFYFESIDLGEDVVLQYDNDITSMTDVQKITRACSHYLIAIKMNAN
jgi:hypothetical protein